MKESNLFIRDNIPILAFHKVDPNFEWGVTRVTPNQFKVFLEFLKENNFQTISLADYFNSQVQLPPKPIVITFDDSYASVFEYAFPLLRKFGFTATVFIITGYAGDWNWWDVNLGGCKFRHLSWSQVRTMSDAGFEIGSHTVHHPDLTRLSDEIVKKEISLSRIHLEEMIEKSIRLISFPFGRYNNSVIDLCKQAGYTHGCGFWIQKNCDRTFVFERKAYYLFDNLWTLQAKLDHHWGHVIENAKLKVINFCSHGTCLVKPAKFERYNK